MNVIQSKHGGANVWLPPPLFFAAGVVAGLLVQYAVRPFPAPIGRTPRLIAACVVGVAGLGLGLSTLLLFRRSGQDPRPWKPSPEMILRGPYRFSRNPMYVGMLLLQSSIGLFVDDLWIVLLSVPALILVHYTAVLPEERYLADRFGEAYQNYIGTVRRYL